MEEGFGLLRSAFTKANTTNEQIACILRMAEIYLLVSILFSISLVQCRSFSEGVHLFDIISFDQDMVY